MDNPEHEKNSSSPSANSKSSEALLCKQKALEYLGRAEQFHRGLQVKLLKKGFSPKAIESALKDLESVAFLDDGRYARCWVRYRLRRQPEGHSKLRERLMVKGIEEKTAREAVNAVFRELGDENAEQALERAITKLSRRRDCNKDKMFTWLLRRGFKSSLIRRRL